MIVPDLMTNRNLKGDFIRNSLEHYSSKPRNVLIAVAFFTDADSVLMMANNGCQVKLVVRLGYPTAPEALAKVIDHPQISVRYVTDQHFHPKLYWFSNGAAIVGSANLTYNALSRNQEIAVEIQTDDPRYDELGSLFADYWVQSEVLNHDIIEKYRKILERHKKGRADLEKDMKNEFPEVLIANIAIEKERKSKADIFLDDYRKSYQDFLMAFRELAEVYQSMGQRKEKESAIPLRLEIDSFVSFIREEKAGGDNWKDPIASDIPDRKKKILSFAKEWLETDWDWFSNQIVPTRYPLLKKTFQSEESIRSSTNDELYEGLSMCHAFKDSRHYIGKHDEAKRQFFANNERRNLDKTLIYLVHGKQDAEVRMCRCIFDDEYRLWRFGRSCVQELVGWISRENLPICNGRTTKVLHFLGYNIETREDRD